METPIGLHNENASPAIFSLLFTVRRFEDMFLFPSSMKMSSTPISSRFTMMS